MFIVMKLTLYLSCDPHKNMRREILEICFCRTFSTGTHTSKSVKRGMAMAACKQSSVIPLAFFQFTMMMVTNKIKYTPPSQQSSSSQKLSQMSPESQAKKRTKTTPSPHRFSRCSPNEIEYTPSLQQSSSSKKVCTTQFAVSRIPG
jgi:hypothetical protein